METPLITEATTSGGGDGRQRQKPSQQYRRRSDAIAYGSRYQKAAALVDLAEDGIGLPEEVLNDIRFDRVARFYFIYIRFNFLWSLNLCALILLSFLEKPLWCFNNRQFSCQEREYFFLGELPYLTHAQSFVYEGITLLILILHTFFPIAYEGWNLFLKNLWNKLKVIFLLLLMCDIVVYALFVSPVSITYLPFRIAPYIRIAFVTLSIRELRTCVVTLAGMLGMYLNVLALWLLFLLFSSWLAYVTFEDTQQGKIMFSSFGTTLYQMFVLFTTSNNPDVWIPAYKKSRWSCIFFILYVLLGVYFITNLILAVVYDSFKAQLVKQVIEMDNMRISILGKAFGLIDNFNQGFLNKEQCICLFEELNRYRSLPKTSREDFELIFDELDHSGDFKINLEEFTDLCNAIALRFQKEATPSCFENYPSFYHSPQCEKLKAFVRSSTFGYIIAFVLVLNLIAVIIETTLDIENSSAQQIWQEVEFFFGWIYIVEVALKVFTYGFRTYWMEGQNRFDFVITWIIVIGEATTFFFSSELPFLSNGEWIRYLLIGRMLRLLRLLLNVQQYRGFVATFLTLIPSLMPYLGIIFCVLCIYCSVGVQLFGGIVNAGNAILETTDLFQDDYLLFNFNDYANGMVTLFNLLVMGNWQTWMQSYKDLTGSSWTLIYFVSFYLITVLLLLNLVIAFVLEAFFAEMEIETTTNSADTKDALGKTDRRRLVGLKTRSRAVDNLLHHMLSAELSETRSSQVP
ncbi:two pore calcium channel protein 1 isoform X1 [Dendrobium catenatum]|uniref:two pore calcium channel protein 1 isoform X1 n=1 Tax=Dendrobium catenatum TaxID=906689 RepID=UPI0009F2A17C|nr:two pore calcium channel protein 1 isoform X1 [Dendrobium catenatum]XP_020702090.1 two pore calcium channel protein 1 isoform X1 [Dendrobium catenatum]